MPAKAGIQGRGGALVSGGIHTLHRPPWRGHRTLPSTLSARPPQPTVMPAKAGIQGSGGAVVSGGIHTLPPTSLARPPIPCRPPPWGGRHSLPSCPRRRASRVWRGTPLGRHPHPPSTSLGSHPYPAVNPFVEAATAYRHAREGGHPGSGGALVSGGIHTLRQPPWRSIDTPRQPPWRGIHILPSTPSWRPPQPTVMPAKAGIQWSGGHSSREAAKLSLRHALIHYRNFMNHSVRNVLTKHERRF